MNRLSSDPIPWLIDKGSDSTRQAMKYLRAHGFRLTHDPDKLPGRKVAIASGTFHHSFIMYCIDGLEKQSKGFSVQQDESRVLFSETKNADVLTAERTGLELFLPGYMLEKTGIFVGDYLLEGKLVEALQQPYPPKIYLSAYDWSRLHPDLYQKAERIIMQKRMNLSELEEQLKSASHKAGINLSIETRVKTPASALAWLYNRPGLTLGEMWDINGVRLLPDTTNDCYAALELVHTLMPLAMVSDCISVPKPNGYQCLIAWPLAYDKLEVQIQTPKMKEYAEHGPASDYRVFLPDSRVF